MQGGDAADEFVRIMLNGTEVAIRLTGSAAKNLAALLIAWSKNDMKVYGRTTMMKLLKSGDELRVLPMTKEQYRKFKSLAKKKVLYKPFINRRDKSAKLQVVVKAKSLPLINDVLKEIGYGDVERQQAQPEEAKKKDTPSKQSSKDVKARSGASRDGQDHRQEKQSVKEKLEKNREYLEKQAPQKAPSRNRNKQKSKGRGR